MVLNGAPRSGKSSIAAALGARSLDWVTLGVDAMMARLAAHQLPGLGLRPGGERPDLEPQVKQQYQQLYAEVRAAAATHHVVVDAVHHDDYSQPLHTLASAGRELDGMRAYLVGVRCPLEQIMARRETSGGTYLGATPDGKAPVPVLRWQTAVHTPGLYDLEVNTAAHTAEQCAQQILDYMAAAEPRVLARLARPR